MNILVTGAAGFIGSSLADLLLDQGHAVIAIDNFDPYYPRALKEKNIENALKNPEYLFIEGDIRNGKDLRKCFNQMRIDTVIHLAAKAGVRPSLRDPAGYYSCNVMGTLSLLENMVYSGVNKLVLASSSSVYGNNKKVPFSESDPVDHPISPYAASKKAGELLCHTYHHLHGFDVFCLRLFTVYGPRQRPDLAIRKFTALLMNGKPIPFFGDGSTTRDYTHISDLLKGIIAAVSQLSGYEIINLGGSHMTSLKELVNMLESFTGKNAAFKQMPMQSGDVNTTYADITKAKELLAYNPSWTLEDGIKDFIAWFIEQDQS
jgi:UDP-glucuronate 4-epimerase